MRMPILRQTTIGFPEDPSRLWRVKSKLGPDGMAVIRYVSFISQLKRIALQFDLQLQSTTLTSDGVQRMAFAWRLTTECFSIQVNYKYSSGMVDCEPVGGGSTTFDELVTITAVLFEYNHDKVMPCPELVSDLNSGNFDSLFQHVANLVTVYAVPGNKIDRARAYMCLEAVEQDLSMLSQVPRSPDASVDQRSSSLNSLSSFTSLRQQLGSRSDVFALRTLVNQSLVGHFAARSGGRLARLTYLVTPAQAAVFRAGRASSASRKTQVSSSIVGKGSIDGLVGGHMARVGLRPRAIYPEFTDSDRCQSSGPQQLAFIPLVTLQEDTNGNRLPDFAKPDDITCVTIEAEFVLYLDPPVPLTSDAIRQLQHITGLVDSDFGIVGRTEEQDLVQVILSRHGQQHLYGINTHLEMPNMTQHSYEIHSNLRGYLVSQIPFTCSSQLSSIVCLLRQHASASAFFETFVLHPRKPVVKDDSLTFHFVVTIQSTSLMSIQFDHPCDVNRTVQLDLEIGQFEVERASVSCNPNESDNSVDPLPILARTHALPIGLVWMLTALGCPSHRKLPLTMSKLTKSQHRCHDNDEDADLCEPTAAARLHSLTSPKLLSQLRTMLDRARSHIIIQDATGTGGVLSGADRFAALDLEAPLMPTTTITSTSSLKMAPLPPGVLATPPPMFSHSENHPSDLVTNVLSTVRYGDFPARSRPTGMHSSSPPPPNFNPRTLRLDDLLIDNLFQQCSGPTHPSASGDITSTGGKSTTTPPTTTPPKPLPGTRDLGDCLSSPPTLSIHSSVLGGQSAVFSTPSLQSVSQQQPGVTTGYPLTPYSGRPGQITTPPSVPISIPGTFTQTPLLVNQMTSGTKHPSGGSTSSNKSSTSNSGSMLVNLLNEDPLPPSNPVLLSQLPHSSSRSIHPPSSQNTPVIPGILDASRELYNMPTRLQSSAPGSSPPPVSASGLPSPLSSTRSTPTGGSQHIPPTPPGLVTSKHSIQQQSTVRTSPASGAPTPSNAVSIQKSAPTLGQTQASNLGPTTISKKPRKRRRGSSDGFTPGTFQKAGSLVSSTPQTLGVHGLKHQRIDTPTGQHPGYHRSTFSGTSTYGLVASTMTSPSHSTLTTIASATHSSSILSSGKSVYDFDDTASSMFDLSSSSSVSSFSGSAIGVSATKLSSSSSASYSASGSSLAGASGPSCSQVANSTAMPAFERTVERKTSLKISIKTLPPQRLTGKSAMTTSCVVKQDGSTVLSNAPPHVAEHKMKLTTSTQSVKKRKRRSVDGKPSSYVLQMLQNSGGSSSSPGAGPSVSTPAGLMKVNKCSTSLSHATLIVKKERKRRATHGSDKLKHLPVTTSLCFSSAGEGSGSIIDDQKTRKLERMPRDPETIPQVSKTGSALPSSAPTVTTPVKTFRTSAGVTKKKQIHASSSIVSDESAAIKRSFSSLHSSSVSHSGEYKRKKHMESSKSFPSASHSLTQLIPSGSESEDTNTMTTSYVTPSSTHSSPGSAKMSRSSSNLGIRGGGSNHCSMKRAQNNPPFLSAPISTPTSSHASGGLIKGYKIPKKKAVSASVALVPPCEDQLSFPVPDSNASVKPSLSCSTDSSMSDPCLATIAVSTDTWSTTQAASMTAQPSSPTQTDSVASTQQGSITSSKAVPPIPGSSSNPFGQQSQPRRQSVKSISDIVDKLRAKSTTGNNPTGPSTVTHGANGSKRETNSDLPAAIEGEQPNSSPIGPLEISGVFNERNTPQDPRGDNIFEKFYIENPTSSTTTDPGITTRISVSTAQGIPEDPTVDVIEREEDVDSRALAVSGDDHLESGPSGLDSSEDVSTGEHDATFSGPRPAGQYVVIKAQTDTPASPAESSAPAVSTTLRTTSTSKIIPISSPTGSQRLHSSQSRVKTTDRQSGSLMARKALSSVLGSRFPRPTLGSTGPLSHSGPEGYMRSATGGRLRRPSRGFPHGMHRPKNAAYKGASVWSSSGGQAVSQGDPMSGNNAGVVGAPWMMSQSGGPLPPPVPGPPMPHSFHSAGPQQRPLRPPFGPPGGVNMYGGPMRGTGKQG